VRNDLHRLLARAGYPLLEVVLPLFLLYVLVEQEERARNQDEAEGHRSEYDGYCAFPDAFRLYGGFLPAATSRFFQGPKIFLKR
jgi:hypothetical protein